MANNLVGVAHVLLAIGFEVAVECTNIMAAAISEFEDFHYLVEKDIRDMADEFGKRRVANCKILFGLGRTKKLTGVMHWVQDCHLVNDVLDHKDFNVEILYQSLRIAQIRKSDMDLVATKSKAADLGKFKD